MGFGWQELLIVLVIVALIFGTKKLRNIGSDLGALLKALKILLPIPKTSKRKTSQNKTYLKLCLISAF